MFAVATNMASSLLPPGWRPPPWLVWPAVVLLALASAVVGIWQFGFHASHEKSPRDQDRAGPSDSERAARGTKAGQDRRQPHSASMNVVPAQLPPDITAFTGRESELATLRNRIAPIQGGSANGGSRAVAISTIVGKPGIGKSALAIHLAHQLAASFPDGQLYVDLRGGRPERLSPPEVLSQFLRALGVVEEKALMDFDEQVARYRSLLAGRHILLVLDNAADAVQVRPLLPGSQTCAVLITSRNPLYSLEGATPLTLDVLDAATAVELLGKLAGPERTAHEFKAAGEIASYCGKLPLALRIAGAKLAARPAWPLAILADRLADERRRLSELRAGDLEVRTSFTPSYQDLESADARVFRLLSLLDGPDVAAGIVATLSGVSPEEAERSLERLLDAQLLETPAPDRYRLHDLLRLFAQERVQEEESEETRTDALKRAIRWYRASLEIANERLGPERLQHAGEESIFPNYAAALSWLEAERPNLVAAIRQAYANGWDSFTWQLSENLFDFFNLRKYWRDWQTTSELGLQAAQRSGDQRAQGRMLHNHGYVLRERRSYQEAIALIEESIAIFRGLDDRFWEGRALGTLGTAYRSQQRFQQAIDCYEQSLRIRREVGDRLGEGQTLQAIGTTYRQHGRVDNAIDALRASLAIFQEIGDRRGESRTLGLLGNTYLEQQRPAEAAALLKRSLFISRETGARYVEARTLTDLGQLFTGQRRYAEAVSSLEEALAIFRTIGDRYAEGQTLRNLAIVFEASGDRKSARVRWNSALAVLGDLAPDDAAKISLWLNQPGQPRSPWSEWGIW
jgi:tetratricopeptide (TPR) repeat protein